MENTSKALIIAGAVFFALILIGVAVFILGSAEGIFEDQSIQMSKMEIEEFNNLFLKYEGRQTGTNVKTLLQKTAMHNVTCSDTPYKQVTLNGGLITTNELAATVETVRNNSSYVVSFEYHRDNSGLIVNILTSPQISVTRKSLYNGYSLHWYYYYF